MCIAVTLQFHQTYTNADAKHTGLSYAHLLLIVYRVCTVNTHGTPPPLHYPSFITFTFCSSILLSSLPFLSIFRFSFFLSFSPAFPLVSRGWTCCRSDMQQHACVTTLSPPFTPSCRRIRSAFAVHPSPLHCTGHLSLQSARQS